MGIAVFRNGTMERVFFNETHMVERSEFLKTKHYWLL